jgi:menaquinone-dependent protoporphyrinogen oxidase
LNVLVSAASRHGATVEVAASIGATLQAAGHTVYVVAPGEVDGLEGFDAAVIGSAIYAGRWLEPARLLLECNKSSLRTMAVWLFASGPIGDPPKPDHELEEAARLVSTVKAREHRTFAGSLDRKRLGFAEKALVAAVRAPDGDFRPWPEIEAWAHGIAAELTALETGSGSGRAARASEPVLAGAGR